MVLASAEIILLVSLAALVGAVTGFGIGYTRREVTRRRRTKANLKQRLIATRRAIDVLEQTVSDAGRASIEADTGTRLSERVAAARATEQVGRH